MSAGIARATASPNLALVKYWGKADVARNLPATPSVGITLGGLVSHVTARVYDRSAGGSGRSTNEDRVVLDGTETPIARYRRFFDAVRAACGIDARFECTARNDYPTAAGVASSAGGFAAMAAACVAATSSSLEPGTLSAVARVGSASAARSIFAGFSALPAGAEEACQLFPPEHWPELRVIVAVVDDGPKGIGSRDAMERSRTTSPLYRGWVQAAPSIYREAVVALETRDLERLGEAMQASYLTMFGTMISSRPAVRYWRPDTIRVQDLSDRLRRTGVAVWETMDAGPQVKLLCTADDQQTVIDAIQSELPELAGSRLLVGEPGPAVSVARGDG